MTRKKFIILLILPFLLIFPLLMLEMPLALQIAVFVFVCLYTWCIQFLRLRYLGFSWKQCIVGFFVGALGNTWWKMWQKDETRKRPVGPHFSGS